MAGAQAEDGGRNPRVSSGTTSLTWIWATLPLKSQEVLGGGF